MSIVRFQTLSNLRTAGHAVAVVAHSAQCGNCGRWLSVSEEELLSSLIRPVVCWNCDTGRSDLLP